MNVSVAALVIDKYVIIAFTLSILYKARRQIALQVITTLLFCQCLEKLPVRAKQQY